MQKTHSWKCFFQQNGTTKVASAAHAEEAAFRRTLAQVHFY